MGHPHQDFLRDLLQLRCLGPSQTSGISISGQGIWNLLYKQVHWDIVLCTGVHGPQEGFLDFIPNEKGGH